MPKLKVQMKSEVQMTKFKKRRNFDIESFEIHLAFGF